MIVLMISVEPFAAPLADTRVHEIDENSVVSHASHAVAEYVFAPIPDPNTSARNVGIEIVAQERSESHAPRDECAIGAVREIGESLEIRRTRHGTE